MVVAFDVSSIVRIILGIPFLLICPGYALVTALFPKRETLCFVERAALSVAMSMAIVAAVGIALNFTPWGFRLGTVVLSVTVFTCFVAVFAFARRTLIPIPGRLAGEFSLRLPASEGGPLNKILSIVLVLAILGTITVIGWTIAVPREAEAFTELYVLGHNGKMRDYPTGFVMEAGQISQVAYSSGSGAVDAQWGEVTIVIVNHEQNTVIYSVKITIDDTPTGINYGGTIVDQLGGIELRQGEKWEQEIGFAPRHIGDGQKVEFLLLKDGKTSETSLHLWINVIERW
jgi:uncharacterized membrane protein